MARLFNWRKRLGRSDQKTRWCNARAGQGSQARTAGLYAGFAYEPVEFLIYSQPRELADARASIDVCGCCQFGHCVQVV